MVLQFVLFSLSTLTFSEGEYPNRIESLEYKSVYK